MDTTILPSESGSMPRTRTPPPSLARWVDAFWFGESDGSTFDVLPDGCMDFVFIEGRRPVLVGTMTCAEAVRLSAGTRSFGVRFRPGAAALFADVSPAELVDARAPLDAVVSPAFVRRVRDASSDAERVRQTLALVLDGAARVRRAEPRVERACALLDASHGGRRIVEVAREVGIGTRQLERLFVERLGIGPKRYARIARMQHAERLRRAGTLRGAEIAARAGYADEAHLCRELRALCGAAPAELDVAFVQPPAALPR